MQGESTAEAVASPEPEAAMQGESTAEAVASPEPEAAIGWTLSGDMSPEMMARVQGMISLQGLQHPAPDASAGPDIETPGALDPATAAEPGAAGPGPSAASAAGAGGVGGWTMSSSMSPEMLERVQSMLVQQGLQPGASPPVPIMMPGSANAGVSSSPASFGGEKVLLEVVSWSSDAGLHPSSGGTLPDSAWSWVRGPPVFESGGQDTGAPWKTSVASRVEDDGALVVQTLPGGLWQTVFPDCGLSFPALLLTPVPPSIHAPAPANSESPAPPRSRLCFQLAVTLTPSSWGEQAGIFWYLDDSNYVKLVVEGGRDPAGSASVVFAAEEGGVARVLGKVPLTMPSSPESADALPTQTLRVELSADGTSVSGLLDNGYCARVVGKGTVPAEMVGGEGGQGLTRVGVSAHGGTADSGGRARFGRFSLLEIAGNRVSF